MIFNTYWFVCAVIPYLVLYLAIPVARLRFYLLILFCLVFHFHFAGPAGVIPIFVLGSVTYLCALSNNRVLIQSAIFFCVAALCFYKYTFFISEEIVSLFFSGQGRELASIASSSLPASPPLAISFFTFEFVHYLYEVLKGGRPIEAPLKFVSFAIFFPSLVAGPIKRYQQFLPSLEEALGRTDWRLVASGVLLVAVGFFKKLVVADNLTLFTEAYSNRFVELSLAGRWFFLLALSYRIYMDFSGYSDIAIGLARIMGVSLPANFNWPYCAENIRDFWQRWHISLSSWIRDYIYIPLGGSRSGQLRTLFNAAVAFALCGLWHGPHWHFVLWGLYHGFGFAVCAIYRKAPFGSGEMFYRFLARFPLLKVLLTFLFVSFGWLLFFYDPQDAFFKCSLLFWGRSL